MTKIVALPAVLLAFLLQVAAAKGRHRYLRPSNNRFPGTRNLNRAVECEPDLDGGVFLDLQCLYQ